MDTGNSGWKTKDGCVFIIAMLLNRPISIFATASRCAMCSFIDDLIDAYEAAESDGSVRRRGLQHWRRTPNTISLLDLLDYLAKNRASRGFLRRETGGREINAASSSDNRKAERGWVGAPRHTDARG